MLAVLKLSPCWHSSRC